jgi:hypothetical protein
MEFILLAPGGRSVERLAHRLCAESENGEHRCRGEWFNLDTHVESCIDGIILAGGDSGFVAELWSNYRTQVRRRRAILGQGLLAITGLAQAFNDNSGPLSSAGQAA